MMRLFSRFYFTACLLGAGVICACSSDSGSGPEPEPQTTELKSIVVATSGPALSPELAKLNPTVFDVSLRAAAGHTLSVTLDGNDALYQYSSDKWIPSADPLQFGEGNAPLKLLLGSAAGISSQDGTLEKLIDADEMTYSAPAVAPAENLSGISMTHANSLIEVRMDASGITGDVTIGGYKAFKLEGYDRFQALTEPAGASFDVVVGYSGNDFQFTINASDVGQDQFKAGARYTVKLATSGNELTLERVDAAAWIEETVPEPEPEPSGNVIFHFGDGFPQGTAVMVTMEDGTEHTVEPDEEDATKGAISEEEGNVIKSLQMAGGPVLKMGHVIGEDIVTVYLGSDGKIAGLPLEGAVYRVNSIADLLFIDKDGMQDHAYRQYAHIDLMNEAWTPLFSYPLIFTGTYDGGDFEIRNINANGDGYIGFFSHNSGTLENITIASGKVRGETTTGAVCGYNEDGTVRNCVNKAEVTCTTRGGGIVGMTASSTGTATVEDCHNYGRVKGGTQYTGGIVGANPNGNTVKGCTNEGEVTGILTVGGIVGDNHGEVLGCRNTSRVYGAGQGDITSKTGGICGANGNTGIRTARIADCENTGTLEAHGCVGGLSGENYGIIEASANKGSIDSKSSFTGGLVGDNYGKVYACYTTGLVKGFNNIGGFVGDHNGGAVVEACYTTSTVESSGERVGVLVGRRYSSAAVNNSYYVAVGSLPLLGSTTAVPETAYEFSSDNWPSETLDKWKTGNDYENGKYWKSLGQWSITSPVYPTLNWE